MGARVIFVPNDDYCNQGKNTAGVERSGVGWDVIALCLATAVEERLRSKRTAKTTWWLDWLSLNYFPCRTSDAHYGHEQAMHINLSDVHWPVGRRVQNKS